MSIHKRCKTTLYGIQIRAGASNGRLARTYSEAVGKQWGKPHERPRRIRVHDSNECFGSFAASALANASG